MGKGGSNYLAEIDALHAFAAQRRTNWWTGTGLASAYYELDHLVPLYCFPSHMG